MKNLLKMIDIYPQNFFYLQGWEVNEHSFRRNNVNHFFNYFIICRSHDRKRYLLSRKTFSNRIYQTEKFTPSFRINQNITKIGFSITKWIDLVDDPSFIKIIPFFYLQTKNKNGTYIYREYFLEIEDCKKSELNSMYFQKCIKNLDVYILKFSIIMKKIYKVTINRNIF